ncbi:MAG: hypothetical protein GC154_17640 [bacterium]|nr:hypothetical protein [bacterium]
MKLNRSTLFLSVIVAFALMNQGCVMKSAHYKTFLDVRNETAKNYSQQVVDSTVRLIDDAQLPVFFSVEAGNAAWAPTATGQIGATIPAPWRASTTTLAPGLSLSEQMSNALQFNDFGSAAMYRIILLYGVLCYPYVIEDTTFPNGVLYTVFSIQDSPKGLDYATKMKDGRWLGVPEEKKYEFVKFSNDVTNWSRHAQPDPSDLYSTAGVVYRYFTEYMQSLVKLADTVSSVSASTKALEDLQKQLEKEQKELDDVQKQAATTKIPPLIFNTMLTNEREDVTKKQDEIRQAQTQLGQAKMQIVQTASSLRGIIGLLAQTMETVEKYDPDVKSIDSDAEIASMNDKIAKIMQGDTKILQELQQFLIHGSGGLKASETTDELYRERFESLPDRFNTSYESLN